MKYIDEKIVYEVGDWVIVNDYHKSYDGKALNITKITDRKFAYFAVLADTFGTPNFSLKDIVRPATQPEIDKAMELLKPTYKVGDWMHLFCKSSKNEYIFQISSIGENRYKFDKYYDVTLNSHKGSGFFNIYEDRIFRLATPQEIEEAKQNDRIMVGEYEVKFTHNDSIIDPNDRDAIEVGCKRVNKETFLKIGKRAGWI